MQQNLWLAVIYNAIAVPVAIAGLRDAADRRRRDVRLLDPRHAQRVALRATADAGGRDMNVLIYLVPMALALGLTGLAAFLWSLRAASTTTWKARRCASSTTTTSRRRSARRSDSAVARMSASEIRERCCKSLGRSRISLTLNAGYRTGTAYVAVVPAQAGTHTRSATL